VHDGEVAEVGEAKEIAGEVLGLAQSCLVHLEHLLELLYVLVDDGLVAFAAKERREDALYHDGDRQRAQLVGLHLKPHVHQCRLLQVAGA